DDGFDDIALLHVGVRLGDLHAGDDDVARASVAPATATEHADAKQGARTRVIGHLEPGFLLNHACTSDLGATCVVASMSRPIVSGATSATSPRVRISMTRQRCSWESGRLSSMRTKSPGLQASFSS